MDIEKRKLHPTLNAFAFEGGLFDVEPCELDLNVGKFGRVVDPNKQGFGTIHRERFEIVGVQKNYRGELCYRVVFESDNNRFGCVLSPEDAVIEE